MNAKKVAYLKEQSHRSAQRYWHGGWPGLELGSVLVPRSDAHQSGIDPLRYELQRGYALGVTDPDQVYFSSDREFARGFAARMQFRDSLTGMVIEQGTLYEVEPLDEIRPDPDFTGGVSWSGKKARVIAVAEENVRLSLYQVTERHGPYSRWTDGSPMYTSTGQYLRSPEQIDAEWDLPLFYQIPAWTPLEFINSWMAGQPTGDRPSTQECSEILAEAAEGGPITSRYFAKAQRAETKRIEFHTNYLPYIQQINTLISDEAPPLEEDDSRGVVFALDYEKNLIGVIVFSAGTHGLRTAMFINFVTVISDWRHNGIGTLLLSTAQSQLPNSPLLSAGTCTPELAPFFAQNGYTVIKPGVAMPYPLSETTKALGATTGQCWFYRQGPL